MVVMYVEVTKPDETFWFKNPIEGSTISLLSCSFTNHMCNLKSEGMLIVGGKVWLHVPKGNYDASALHHLFANAGHTVGDVAKVQPASITIKANGWAAITAGKNIKLSDSMKELLNIEGPNNTIVDNITMGNTKVIRIRQPTRSIHIHCDLIDFTQVMFGNEYKQLLSVIDVGDCGSLVRHPHAAAIQKPMKRGGYISSMRLKITDNKNNVVTEGVYPMILTIEIT